MQELNTFLIATVIGMITGIAQWNRFMRHPLEQTAFLSHLIDLQFHLMVASVIMGGVLLMFVFIPNGIDLMAWAASGFLVAWIGVVAMRARGSLKIPSER